MTFKASNNASASQKFPGSIELPMLEEDPQRIPVVDEKGLIVGYARTEDRNNPDGPFPVPVYSYETGELVGHLGETYVPLGAP